MCRVGRLRTRAHTRAHAHTPVRAMTQSLPNLSGLQLLLDEDTVDTGQYLRDVGIRKSRQRRSKWPGLAQLARKGDPYAGWTDEEDDEDWQVPKVLQGIDRPDAARGRVLPPRRSPAIAEEVRTNQSEAGKLLEHIQSKMQEIWKQMARWYWCEVGPLVTAADFQRLAKIRQQHETVAKGIVLKYVLNPASWIRTAYYKMRGKIHDTIMPESSFRQLFNDYVDLRGGMEFLSDFSKTPEGHFTQVMWETRNTEKVAERLAQNANLFSPLLDAIREFGFAHEEQTEFQVLWRFHPVRHNNASNWHMDSNDFRMYADESMERAEVWTRTGERSVVTTSCLNIDPNQLTDHCGTRVLSGLPALSEKAINSIVDEMWEAKDTLLSYKCVDRDKEKYFAVNLNRLVMAATERAISEYTAEEDMHNYTRTSQDRAEHQARVEELLASAGVKTLTTRNGEIGTFNDHQYHASSTIPEGHVRMFFVMRGKNEDRLGRAMPFRADAQIEDRHGRPAKLSFHPI